mmetsp:Transcript_123700/g.309161  ORF Transcript_123700/g.309161 Transcript_123700/m.309161 type:complete len:434 (-) Transcript_123700:59-1360(-)
MWLLAKLTGFLCAALLIAVCFALAGVWQPIKVMSHSGDLPGLRALSQCGDLQELQAPAPGDHTVVFIKHNEKGSAHMRGDMLAAAVNAQPGWWARAVTPESFREALKHVPQVDACVSVKWDYPKDVAHLCAAKKVSVMMLDVIDNEPMIGKLASGKFSPFVDLYLPASLALARLINEKKPAPKTIGSHPLGKRGGKSQSEPLAIAVPHQHSNRGFQRRPPALPFVCRVSIFSGSAAHMPKDSIKKQLVDAICGGGNGKVASVAFHIQGNPKHPNVRVVRCQHVSDEIKHACDQQPQDWLVKPVDSSGCFLDQDKYHADISVAPTDLALLWPPNTNFITMQRPWTRLLYWMSHGVPAMYFPTATYAESAAMGYLLPDGTPPRAANMVQLQALVGRLAGDINARHALYTKGLEIAANWDSTHVGLKITDIIKKRL